MPWWRFLTGSSSCASRVLTNLPGCETQLAPTVLGKLSAPLSLGLARVSPQGDSTQRLLSTTSGPGWAALTLVLAGTLQAQSICPHPSSSEAIKVCKVCIVTG